MDTLETIFKSLCNKTISISDFIESLKMTLKNTEYIDLVQQFIDSSNENAITDDGEGFLLDTCAVLDQIKLSRVLDEILKYGWFDDISDWSFKKSDLETQFWNTVEQAFDEILYREKNIIKSNQETRSLEDLEYEPVEARKYPRDVSQCNNCDGEDCACCEIYAGY